MKSEELYKRAISHWGAESQIFMALEEMAELSKELCKSRRAGVDPITNHQNIAEEIADVLNMMGELQCYFNCHKLVSSIRKHKMAKMEKLLNSGPSYIQRVKNYRDKYNCGLADAVDAVRKGKV